MLRRDVFHTGAERFRLAFDPVEFFPRLFDHGLTEDQSRVRIVWHGHRGALVAIAVVSQLPVRTFVVDSGCYCSSVEPLGEFVAFAARAPRPPLLREVFVM
jgi:hypothetical protein